MQREKTPSMDPLTAAIAQPDPEAIEFIRFCYQRRRVGWPELYDEMCAVAARGLFRGYGSNDLAGFGVGFSLFEMPRLAAMCRRVIAEEQARRRPVTVTIRADVSGIVTDMPGVVDVAPGAVAEVQAVTEVVLKIPIAPSAVIVPVRSEAVPVRDEAGADMVARSVSPLVRLKVVPAQA
jgi:hypothetical protein